MCIGSNRWKLFFVSMLITLSSIWFYCCGQFCGICGQFCGFCGRFWMCAFRGSLWRLWRRSQNPPQIHIWRVLAAKFATFGEFSDIHSGNYYFVSSMSLIPCSPRITRCSWIVRTWCETTVLQTMPTNLLQTWRRAGWGERRGRRRIE